MTRDERILLASRENEAGEREMLAGNYGLAWVHFDRAATAAVTDSGRAVLQDKAAQAKAAAAGRRGVDCGGA